MDHSIIAYLINPEGEFVAFYGQEELAATMIPKVENQIWEYRKRAFWQSLAEQDGSALHWTGPGLPNYPSMARRVLFWPMCFSIYLW